MRHLLLRSFCPLELLLLSVTPESKEQWEVILGDPGFSGQAVPMEAAALLQQSA